MIRTIQFKNLPVDGDIMRDLIDIMPELTGRFKQRKQYDEYWFEDVNGTILTLDHIIVLSEWYNIKITHESLVIYN
jgi:uncharacterized protein YdeI (BOF family)